MRSPCQQQNVDNGNYFSRGVLASAQMVGRPIFHKQFGEFLAGLRKRKGWTQSDAARFAEQRHLTALTRQVLLHLEAGKTKDPDPSALRDLAMLYGVAYEDIAGEFVAHRFGVQIAGRRDLSRHAQDRVSSSAESQTAGGADHGSSSVADALGRQQSQSSVDAEMRRQFVEERSAFERDIIKTLYGYADGVRAVADALRNAGGSAPAGGGSPDHFRSGPSARRSATRRGRTA